MGLFDFVGNAGKKLFGSEKIDEREVRKHLLSLGLGIKSLSVIATQEERKVALIGKVESLADKEKLILAAGNISGVEQVDDRMLIQPTEPEAPQTPPAPEPPPADEIENAPEPPEEDAPKSQFYTVESGDTLGAIARRFYGNAGKYMVIFEANRPMLEDPDRIYPGQVLRIPEEV